MTEISAAVWLTRRVSRIDQRNCSRQHLLRPTAQSGSQGIVLGLILLTMYLEYWKGHRDVYP